MKKQWYDLEDDVDDAHRREALRRLREARLHPGGAEAGHGAGNDSQCQAAEAA